MVVEVPSSNMAELDQSVTSCKIDVTISHFFSSHWTKYIGLIGLSGTQCGSRRGSHFGGKTVGEKRKFHGQ